MSVPLFFRSIDHKTQYSFSMNMSAFSKGAARFTYTRAICINERFSLLCSHICSFCNLFFVNMSSSDRLSSSKLGSLYFFLGLNCNQHIEAFLESLRDILREVCEFDILDQVAIDADKRMYLESCHQNRLSQREDIQNHSLDRRRISFRPFR